ncbi:MAG: ABC transporter substrate-binding protein [Pseudomonadota bacterium]|nr:ABC transporter substrate-binding protein [Pseudomonadota bacterium]
MKHTTTRRTVLKTTLLGSAAAVSPWLRAQAPSSTPTAVAAPAAASAPAQAIAKIPKLLLAGPSASVSNALIRIVDAGLLADVAEQVEFLPWKDPDQLRAMAVEGKADFMAMPSNVAANLFNRGVALQLLNISIWGLLFVVSRDPAIKTLADLKGKELVMPFRGDMPDIVLRTVAAKLGVPIGEGADAITLRYTATPLEAMQLLLTRRADHALLAEPAVSVGLLKSRSLPASVIAPALHRSVDVQQAWGQAFARAPRIPQAGMVAMGKHLGNAALQARFAQAYAQAQQWCNTQPDACGQAVAKRLPMLTPEGVAAAIRAVPGQVVPAQQARAELEFFFEQLRASQPGLIGGKLPAEGFYGGV